MDKLVASRRLGTDRPLHIKNENLQGPVNIASPNPVQNKDFMKTLRDECAYGNWTTSTCVRR